MKTAKLNKINFFPVTGHTIFSVTDNGETTYYRTNQVGEGLWIGCDKYGAGGTQIVGNTQFQITAKSNSGVRNYIKRELDLS